MTSEESTDSGNCAEYMKNLLWNSCGLSEAEYVCSRVDLSNTDSLHCEVWLRAGFEYVSAGMTTIVRGSSRLCARLYASLPCSSTSSVLLRIMLCCQHKRKSLRRRSMQTMRFRCAADVPTLSVFCDEEGANVVTRPRSLPTRNVSRRRPCPKARPDVGPSIRALPTACIAVEGRRTLTASRIDRVFTKRTTKRGNHRRGQWVRDAAQRGQQWLRIGRRDRAPDFGVPTSALRTLWRAMLVTATRHIK
ncbi:uncharacterized protein C8Q71DRAFT_195391 [Rhodofomes roseus]|uniref:Uncharacterized protein n=1 Tax=Rhodofomes roseus TaxID=34475 RepID=A0ABQ8K7P2_9APHY|nr:uncharacterized protein C8Q71DRAFT_195391 [Rhodofomes roseus]KAH9833248.1 hypothetical protein C8Q71DRAFT_195391 [Rhodofomes roseus]